MEEVKVKSPRYGQALSPREAEVFALVALGHTSKKTSEILYIHEKTVKFHLTNIYKKCAVTHRGQLISGWFTRSLREEVIAPVHRILPTHEKAMKEEAARAVLPSGAV